MQYAKDPRTDRSLRHSVRDGMASSVMTGGAETYLSAFALFFKASASQVAMLTTLPALLGALGQVFSAWLKRHGGRRQPLIVAAAAMQSLIWLALLVLTLVLPTRASSLELPGFAVPLILILATVYFFCGHIAQPLWTSLMGDLVPEQRRGRYFGHRTRLTTITGFGALVAGGLVLHITDTLYAAAWGFVAIFALAFVARVVSVWHLARMHEPVGSEQNAVPRVDRTWWRDLRDRGAPWFSIYVFAMQAACSLAAPLFAIYMLNVLEFSYLMLMLVTGTGVLTQFLTLSYWGRIGDVFGNKLVLSINSLLLPLAPALWLVSDNFWFLMAVQGVYGMASGGFVLSTANLLYDTVPAAKRATYSAGHSVLVALGIFGGAMIGVGLFRYVPAVGPMFSSDAVATPLMSVFLISALARLAVALGLLGRVPEARRPRCRLSTAEYFARVTRLRVNPAPFMARPVAAPVASADEALASGFAGLEPNTGKEQTMSAQDMNPSPVAQEANESTAYLGHTLVREA